ncbi:MarR family winged helix-turn-helix transcriptional regulator [Kitasatospora sp. LaBMicrA B282]|uniref:MarR family winged helix-turn-helix transcriptional regulator n=1 Tax=Kitasatospora sp. LaBMicrA B282 TaxID=3420949 RepID=UPI003D123034
MTAPTELKPIGYYVKLLDDLLDGHFDEVLVRFDRRLTRRHWQVLHTLATSGPNDEATLSGKLLPFWGEGAIRLAEVTGDLADLGWVAGSYALTPAGDTAHTQVEHAILEARVALMSGITPEEYTATTATLARMCANLEAQQANPAA